MQESNAIEKSISVKFLTQSQLINIHFEIVKRSRIIHIHSAIYYFRIVFVCKSWLSIVDYTIFACRRVIRLQIRMTGLPTRCNGNQRLSRQRRDYWNRHTFGVKSELFNSDQVARITLHSNFYRNE